YRVGRQMRVDQEELENYKSRGKETRLAAPAKESQQSSSSIVISGQDSSLDILGKKMEAQSSKYRPLRSYAGSLDNLIAMYQGRADIISTQQFDRDTNEYNIPYIRKFLVSHSFIVVQFVKRRAGLYTAKGNPHKLSSWEDLKSNKIRMINREKGAGARVLLDEQLRIHNISKDELKGYNNEETSHLAVASAVANGKADVGVGIEQIAKITAIDFIPMIDESYDLVMLKSGKNQSLISDVLEVLNNADFKEELQSLGYDCHGIGQIIWEQ